MQIPKLRQWREFRALTQEELAERAGISARSVAGYEAGAGARPGTVRKLAAALDIEAADLQEAYPKAPSRSSKEAPDDQAVEERRLTLDYDACAEAISGFCDRWESKLAAKQIDRRDLQEFRRTGKLIAATFGVVWEFQIDELRAELGREPTLEEPSLWSVVDRYTDLLMKMRDFEYENFDGATLKEAPVIPMERFRRKEAG